MNGITTLPLPHSELLIIYDLSRTSESSAISSMLDVTVFISDSDAAHLYWMDPAAYELRLVSASPAWEDGRIQRVSLQFPASLLEGGILSAGDPGFDSFPETVAREVSSLLVLPLRVGQKPAGLVTLSSRHPDRYQGVEIGKIQNLCEALVAAMRELERESEMMALRARLRNARQENLQLERRLAERILVERAKGLLQTHYGWTEEDAYYHLRKTSRQSRAPMAVVAQRVVDFIAAVEVERERLPA